MSTSRTIELFVQIALTFLTAFYSIYFVGRWGQTIGKMALKIKVVALDGSEAGFERAFYRYSVDLAFSIISTAMTVHALFSITGAAYDSLSFDGKMKLLIDNTPSWSAAVDALSYAWIGSELVVLLFNKKRRALHDFIAGTVVTHTQGEAVVA
jgi:uncharacterized RDD family membrane protein YckC